MRRIRTAASAKSDCLRADPAALFILRLIFFQPKWN